MSNSAARWTSKDGLLDISCFWFSKACVNAIRHVMYKCGIPWLRGINVLSFVASPTTKGGQLHTLLADNSNILLNIGMWL